MHSPKNKANHHTKKKNNTIQSNANAHMNISSSLHHMPHMIEATASYTACFDI